VLPVLGKSGGADQRVSFVNEQNHWLGARLHFVDDRTQASIELALYAGAGLQQARRSVSDDWRRCAFSESIT